MSDQVFEIICDDGTPFNPPTNPLLEKYPPVCKVFDGYSCMFCNLCPRGEYYQTLPQDIPIEELWLKELSNYLHEHCPSLYNFNTEMQD
jgi:hypothetical protein